MEKGFVLLTGCFAVMACLCGVRAVCDSTILSQPVDQAFIGNPLAAWKDIFYYVIRSSDSYVCIETRQYNSVTGKLEMTLSPQPIDNVFHGVPTGKIINYLIDFSKPGQNLTFVLYNDAVITVAKNCTWNALNSFTCADNYAPVGMPSRAHSTWNINGQIVTYSTISANPLESPASPLRLKWPADTWIRNALNVDAATTGSDPAAFDTVTGLLQVDSSTLIALGKDSNDAPVSGRINIKTKSPNNTVYALNWIAPPALGYSMMA